MVHRTDDIEKILTRHGACPESLPWALRYGSLEELWEGCDAPDWMLWALDAFEYAGDHKLRLFAVSCAFRVQRFWDDPQAPRALDTAANVAAGRAGQADLAAAYAATWNAREAIAKRADGSEAMAAAASTVLSAVRDLAMDAAMDASRESARAVWWDPSSPGSWPAEGAWQSNELRRIIGLDIHPLIANVRRKARRVLSIL